MTRTMKPTTRPTRATMTPGSVGPLSRPVDVMNLARRLTKAYAPALTRWLP